MPATPSFGEPTAVRRVIVLGGGTAGLIAALTVKRKLPGIEVEVIRSSQIGIITVGEGSLFSLPTFLHGVLGIDAGVFHRAVRPTYKLGIRFLWGSREFFPYTFTPQLNRHFHRLPRPNGYYCDNEFDYADVTAAMMARGRAFERQANGAPLISGGVGYHLENKRFVDFLETAAAQAGITITDDVLSEAVPRVGEPGIAALRLASGRTATADLFIDCSGFRSELLGRALGEPFIPYDTSLFCDRAVVGGWARTDEPLAAYTTAETMDAGWAWQIEHEPTVNRGYVYSSAFISDEDAEREFRAKNPRLGDTRIIKFRSGSHRRPWVGNVVAIGNSAGFVEPLEATAIAIITNQSHLLVNSLRDTGGRILPSQAEMFNRHCRAEWDEIRRFLALHYKFNTRLDTPFWRACRADTDLAGAEGIVEQYQAIGPSQSWSGQLLQHPFFGMEGYLVMFVGMRVPHRSTHVPSEGERAIWRKVVADFRERADQAMTQEQALACFHSEGWKWNAKQFVSQATKHFGSGAANFAPG
jgi:tryptophan halogenase